MRRNAFVLHALLLLLFFTGSPVPAGEPGDRGGETTFMLRCDDAGMCHAVNQALREVIATGMPVSVSVMFACPWYREAVEILRGHEGVSVGVHLTLNAEWKNYRWGPVAGGCAVPTLVDSEGYFFPTRAELFLHAPDTVEAERELRAQIVRALRSGVRIDYLDYHMSAAVSTPAFRRIVERLAREYGLGISRYFGEEDLEGWYAVPPAAKKDTLLARAAAAEGGPVRLLVFHVGLRGTEMDALEDLNTFGLKEMSAHREAELRALTSPDFRRLLEAKRVRLQTYADMKASVGAGGMKRPAGD
ncbi:MAG TPA: ChbG/HpnK family deacetylase [Bacteroidota bacterium]|nr:ChbG/HpnK family deacetylase [Bacteroidota bacterium]